MAYSTDFKRLVLKYRRSGHTVKETCEFSGIAPSTFYEWEKEEEMGFPPKAKRRYEKKIRKEKLKKAIEERPKMSGAGGSLRYACRLFGKTKPSA